MEWILSPVADLLTFRYLTTSYLLHVPCVITPGRKNDASERFSHYMGDEQGSSLDMVLIVLGSRGLRMTGGVCSGSEYEHCYYCTSHRLAPAPFDIK
jgi:hypothetical protein